MLSKLSSASPIVQKGQNIVQNLAKKGHTAASGVANAVGSKINNSKAAHKILDGFIDAHGFNNRFAVIMGLMAGVVIIPRVHTAATRNPNDKEATKDEITEILFRDLTTCTIILFALKIINSIFAGGVGKITKLPMTNKPREKVFETTAHGLNKVKDMAIEFMDAPLSKLKKEGKNILDILHPTGGKIALTDDEFIKRYSGKSTPEEIKKVLDGIDAQRGNSDTVLKNNVIKDLLKQLQDKLAQTKTEVNMGTAKPKDIKELESRIKILEDMSKESNLTSYFDNNGEKLDKSVKGLFIEYFNNPDNSLVKTGRRLNGALRTFALAIEAGFLGFGLPALNQIRLEKKYLSENPTKTKKTKELNKIESNTDKTADDVKITPTQKESQLFKKFVK